MSWNCIEVPGCCDFYLKYPGCVDWKMDEESLCFVFRQCGRKVGEAGCFIIINM